MHLFHYGDVAYTDGGKGREHAYRDIGARATQEQLPRSGSFALTKNLHRAKRSNNRLIRYV